MTRVPHTVGEEERNIPLRVCLTKNEWSTLEWLATEAGMFESPNQIDVFAVVEAVIDAVVSDERGLLQDVKEALQS